MKFRVLGASGLEVSIVGLGCNNFGRRCDAGQTRAVVEAALDAGITLFDTADSYGPNGLSEEHLGHALKGQRDRVVLATKFGTQMIDGDRNSGGASRRYVIRAVEASLRRLQTDWIDLYQLHRPDPHTPIEETLSALESLIQAGKVRYVGNSNFAGWQIVEAAWVARVRGFTPFISAQNEYSLLNRRIETEVLPAAQSQGLSILPYFPLASGALTGKYRKGQPMPQGARLSEVGSSVERFLSETKLEKIEDLHDVAIGVGHSLLELAFGWLLAKPLVASVIAGATNQEQVVANAAAGNREIQDELLNALDRNTVPQK